MTTPAAWRRTPRNGARWPSPKSISTNGRAGSASATSRPRSHVIGRQRRGTKAGNDEFVSRLASASDGPSRLLPPKIRRESLGVQRLAGGILRQLVPAQRPAGREDEIGRAHV